MRLSNFLCLILFFTLAIISSSCYYDKEELLYSGRSTEVNCTTVSAKFAADVKPLIAAKCATAGCHDAAGSAGSTILVTYAQISAMASRINQRSVVEKSMPVDGPLTAAEIAILKCWIDGGALNN